MSYQGLTETDQGIIEQLLARMHHLPITAAIEDATIAFLVKNNPASSQTPSSPEQRHSINWNC